MDTINQEWLNKNSLRSYPISEDSPRCPTNGAQQKLGGYAVLPNYVVVDFESTVLSGVVGTPPAANIRKIVFVGDTITFFFSFTNGGFRPTSVSVNINEHVPNTGYRFETIIDPKTLPYPVYTGCIVIGDLTNLRKDFPEGIYDYGQYDCVFEPTCLRISPVGVTCIRAENSTTGYATPPMIGTVRLVAGENIRFDYDPEHAAIKINAENGAGEFESCSCGSTQSSTVNSINGMSADNIVIEGGDCIKVNQIRPGVLSIVNTCSKPCCGCAELAFINERISTIQTAITRLTNYSETLVQHAMEFKTIVGPSTNSAPVININ